MPWRFLLPMVILLTALSGCQNGQYYQQNSALRGNAPPEVWIRVRVVNAVTEGYLPLNSQESIFSALLAAESYGDCIPIKFLVVDYEEIQIEDLFVFDWGPYVDTMRLDAARHPDTLSIYFFPPTFMLLGMAHWPWDGQSGIAIFGEPIGHVVAHEIFHCVGGLMHPHEGEDFCEDTPISNDIENVMSYYDGPHRRYLTEDQVHRTRTMLRLYSRYVIDPQ